MTIGSSGRKSTLRSSIRAPKFLDKSSGFYGRLDEPEEAREVPGEEAREGEREESWSGVVDGDAEKGITNGGPSPTEVRISGQVEREEEEEAEAFDFDIEAMAEGDGETLLRRKASNRSSRWRRKSSRRKQKEGKEEKDDDNIIRRPSPGMESPAEPQSVEETWTTIDLAMEKPKEEDGGEAARGKENTLVHFPDDQVLIRDKKRGREEEDEVEGEDERRMKREQQEGMKVLKRNSLKNYRKVLDRAFRRGWEAFVANLYSVTLTPATSSSPASSSPALKKKLAHSTALAEFR